MYQPVDDIVNFDDPLWSGVKDSADQFVLGGKHYVAPLTFVPSSMICYDRDVIEAEGLDDPYELYQKGEWDWDTFQNMMKEFVENGTDRYGIGGWWANAFVYTAGETMVTYDGTTFGNNLRSQKIEKAQGVLEDIFKNNQLFFGQLCESLKKILVKFIFTGKDAIDGIDVDLREDYLLLDTESIVTTAVEL